MVYNRRTSHAREAEYQKQTDKQKLPSAHPMQTAENQRGSCRGRQDDSTRRAHSRHLLRNHAGQGTAEHPSEGLKGEKASLDRILYLAAASFKNKGKMTFSTKLKKKKKQKTIARRLAFQEMIEDVCSKKEHDTNTHFDQKMKNTGNDLNN